MKINIGKIDRYARIVIGLTVIGAGIAYQSWWGVIGLVPLLTSFVKWCPAYAMFKFNTCNPFGKGDTCNAEHAS